MQKLLKLLLATLWTVSCLGDIHEISEMSEIFKHLQNADSSTLALFDIDMVLVQPSNPAFQMANMKKYSALSKRVMGEVPKNKQIMFLSLMSMDSDPVLIEPHIPVFLKDIMTRGIPTMAITANLTGSLGSTNSMEHWRIDSLKHLGIDFSQHSPFSQSLVFDELLPYRENYCHYVDGILFVNGTHITKGEALLAFLAKAQLIYSKVIFVDDREDNLKSVEAALKTYSKEIEYVGIHYIGAQRYASTNITAEDFESEWQRLAAKAKELH